MSSFDRRLIRNINLPLLAICLVLFFIGIMNLYSASGVRLGSGLALASYYQKQLVWGLMGFMLMSLLMLFDYRRLGTLAWPVYVVTMIALALVPLIGRSSLGAKRWLSLGFMNFQPSELAKIAILLITARFLSREPGKLGWGGLATLLAIGLLPAMFIIKQPDLGSGMILLLLLGGMILYRGLELKVFGTLSVLLPAMLPLGWFFLRPYQKQRILTFWEPTADPLGSGYHIIQSMIAIGSGNVWGKGYMAGTQSLLRFLPEKHTDFAFAVFGEEWGFVGSLLLVGIFCLFLYQIYVTARGAKERFGSFLAAGIFFYFFWQILINIGMVLGLMPVVGIPLPFISYGGSATIVNFCLIGILLNVSMRRFVFKQS